MLAAVKEKLRELTSAATVDKTPAHPECKVATETKRDDEVRHSSCKALNDVLPPEILVEILNAAIAGTWEPAYKTMTNLSLVCRSWKEAGRGLELSNVTIKGSKQMDALLGHIHATPVFQESNRVVIQRLSVRTDSQQDFHRLPELLGLCRTSLRGLKLDRFLTNVPAVELVLQDAKPEDGSTSYFPNLTSLDLPEFSTEELIVFITSAPNLQLLELHTIRERLPTMTEFFASDRIPKTLKKLRIWIKIDEYDHLNPKSPDLAPLVQLIKERGWKQWVCVHMSCALCVYE